MYSRKETWYLRRYCSAFKKNPFPVGSNFKLRDFNPNSDKDIHLYKSWLKECDYHKIQQYSDQQ